MEQAVDRAAVRYDRDGDQHYDVISAFIKSMRGSDVDAALHYLARMIEAGEDPRFIARRIVIFASEDVGMADPTALQTAVAAAQAVRAHRPARGAGSTWPRRSSTGAGAQVQRRDQGHRRGDRRRAARADRARCPATCATPTTGARRSSATARATSTRTTSRAASSRSSTRPTRWRTGSYYEPTRHGVEARFAERSERLRAVMRDRPAAEPDRRAAGRRGRPRERSSRDPTRGSDG